MPQMDAPVCRRRYYAVVGPQHRLHFVSFLVKIVVFEQFVDFEKLISRIRKSEKFVDESRKTRILGYGMHCTLQLRDTAPERSKLMIPFVQQPCSIGGIPLNFRENIVQCQQMRGLIYQLFSQLVAAALLGLFRRKSKVLQQIHKLLENRLQRFRFFALLVSEKSDDIFGRIPIARLNTQQRLQ